MLGYSPYSTFDDNEEIVLRVHKVVAGVEREL